MGKTHVSVCKKVVKTFKKCTKSIKNMKKIPKYGAQLGKPQTIFSTTVARSITKLIISISKNVKSTTKGANSF